MKILVTGGCGYKGAVLVPKLLAAGHEVRVFDTLWFGRNLPEHPDLEVVQGDIRQLTAASRQPPAASCQLTAASSQLTAASRQPPAASCQPPVASRQLPAASICDGMDAVIHLAGIANDPCGELDAKLTWEVNVLATLRLAEACVAAGVRRFIFASSASVYGIQGNAAVTEDAPLEPVSDYNKTKMTAERVLRSYADGLKLCIVRPATVCGMSPRMRLDTVVNMLTVQALEKGRITAHCGAHGAVLMRPNTHIEDITDLYVRLVKKPWICDTFNAGFENLTVGDTAAIIKKIVPCEVDLTEVADKRSYSVDSSKLLAAFQDDGFAPRRGVADAVRDIAEAWDAGKLRMAERCVNLAWMRKNGWVAG